MFACQRAFDEVKAQVQAHRDHHRVPLKYDKGSPRRWVVTDACHSGIAGYVGQGDDWKTADIAAFFSAKLQPAQQNYPVHELEMLAGLETMKRHRDILLQQKNLSGRQARWMETLSDFDFDVEYVPGAGTVRAPSEYTQYDEDYPQSELAANGITMPVLVGLEASAVRTRSGGRVTQLETAPDGRKSAKSKANQPEKPAGADSADKLYIRLPARSGTSKQSQKLSTSTSVATDENRASEDGGFSLEGEGDEQPLLNPNARVAAQPLPNLETQHANVPFPEFLDDSSCSTTRVQSGKAVENRDVYFTEGQPIAGPSTIAGESILNAPTMEQVMDGLRTRPSEWSDLDIIRLNYTKDTLFKKILSEPKNYRNYTLRDGLLYLKDNERELLCIPESVTVDGRSLREIIISEGHSLLAHLGSAKTRAYLRDHVWWKTSNQKPYGLLNPLDVPSYPWESIGIDFIGPLLSGMVHLIPSRTNYRAPKNIISDRDVLFTSNFWQHLHKLLRVNLKMSSAQMIRNCVSLDQKDWVARLPFFLNTGRTPSSMLWDSPTDKKIVSLLRV